MTKTKYRKNLELCYTIHFAYISWACLSALYDKLLNLYILKIDFQSPQNTILSCEKYNYTIDIKHIMAYSVTAVSCVVTQEILVFEPMTFGLTGK